MIPEQRNWHRFNDKKRSKNYAGVYHETKSMQTSEKKILIVMLFEKQNSDIWKDKEILTN